MNLASLRKAIKKGNYEWKKHTLIRLAERNISQDSILEVILKGEVIEDYPEDQPFPSCLIFKMIENKPSHAVVSLDAQNQKVYIITAYEPTLDKFEPDFKTRRK